MAYSLTQFIYPISEPTLLSKELGIFIDNPRTAEEIAFVRRRLTTELNFMRSRNPGFKIMEEGTLDTMYKWSKYLEDKDAYAFAFYEREMNVSVEEAICKSWILIRYPENEQFETIFHSEFSIFNLFLQRDSRSLHEDTYNIIVSYFHLLGLLCNEEIMGKISGSILVFKTPFEFALFADSKNLVGYYYTHFFSNCNSILDDGYVHDGLISNYYFPDVIECIKEAALIIEPHLSAKLEEKKGEKKKLSRKEKLLFVGDLLRIIDNETSDLTVRLLLLVSIIEFLVTRNPDTNKFNVEDSISRQFVLKASVIIYQNNKNQEINTIKQILKQIYKERSDIAHANYISKDERKGMIESVKKLYPFISAIVIEYLRDPSFVDFLKES